MESEENREKVYCSYEKRKQGGVDVKSWMLDWCIDISIQFALRVQRFNNRIEGLCSARTRSTIISTLCNTDVCIEYTDAVYTHPMCMEVFFPHRTIKSKQVVVQKSIDYRIRGMRALVECISLFFIRHNRFFLSFYYTNCFSVVYSFRRI